MRPGWNPTRRNRNAGTKAQGHGANNRLVVPESQRDLKRFYEHLRSFVVVTRRVGLHDLLFFVEPTRLGWFYPCSVDDICRVLSGCAAEDLSAFEFIVMRQPTRKQRILMPVWGRAAFFVEIAKHSGSAIMIEAQDLKPYCWSDSQGPEGQRELERLRADGHELRRTRRGVEILVTPASMRKTVLHRTLLHEMGHHVDYKRCSEREWDGRTRTEKEDYAHRYARETFDSLQRSGIVPFAPILDTESLGRDGLKLEWFAAVPPR
jgi:hypothetical protein